MTDQLEKIKKTFIKNSMDELLNLKKMFIDAHSSNPDPENYDLANNVFMVMHGISGTAPMVGLGSLEPASRKLEIVFDKIRKGEKDFSEPIKVQTIRGIDAIVEELRCYSEKIAL